MCRTGVWMLGPEPQPIPPEPHLLDRRPPYDERRRGSPDIERYIEVGDFLVGLRVSNEGESLCKVERDERMHA